jgi:hypothetical protein
VITAGDMGKRRLARLRYLRYRDELLGAHDAASSRSFCCRPLMTGTTFGLSTLQHLFLLAKGGDGAIRHGEHEVAALQRSAGGRRRR